MTIEIVYRLDPDAESFRPSTAEEARRALEKGNERFASLASRGRDGDVREIIAIPPWALGISGVAGMPPAQTPFAAILGCSDARAPVDRVFEQAVNDLFVVRVAGNVLGDECLGSLEYASANLETIQLFVVVGLHELWGGNDGCRCFPDSGSVPEYGREPSSAFNRRSAVRVDSLASMALEEVAGDEVRNNPNYRQALIETSVIVNAALAAMTLRQEINRDVAFGVYDLVSRRVCVPSAHSDEDFTLHVPPADIDELNQLGRSIAGSEFVTSILQATA